MATNYETKFADFLRMCEQAKKGKLDVVMVADPETLGDNYEEIVESLNRLADAKLGLQILPRSERGR